MLKGSNPSICVIFATKGRPDILAEAMRALSDQSVAPTSIIVSATSSRDVGDIAARHDVIVIAGPAGLTSQRNAALRRVPDETDIVVFFDDDFIPHPRWLETVADAFTSYPDIACITGNLIADGVSGPGLSLTQSWELIKRYKPNGPAGDNWIRDHESPYGCNMAFRLHSITELEFDERLVEVGWLEDRDFGARLAKRGARLVKIGTALGVHRGIKTAKVSDRCMGYAQVINPFYLHAKGTMATREMVKLLAKHVAINFLRSWSPEPHIDRFARFRGNVIGLVDIVCRRVEPERARDL